MGASVFKQYYFKKNVCSLHRYQQVNATIWRKKCSKPNYNYHSANLYLVDQIVLKLLEIWILSGWYALVFSIVPIDQTASPVFSAFLIKLDQHSMVQSAMIHAKWNDRCEPTQLVTKHAKSEKILRKIRRSNRTDYDNYFKILFRFIRWGRPLS